MRHGTFVPGSRAVPWKMICAIGGLSAASGAAAYAVQRMRGSGSAGRDAMFAGISSAAALTLWEFIWWARRRRRRGVVYLRALAEARRMGRPLVVVGRPDGGVTAGYGCGDLVVDIEASSSCPHLVADITRKIPLPDDSAVVFVSCVLEYVDDAVAALSEILRISGGHVFIVGVEPWTLTGRFYPGAKRTMPGGLRGGGVEGNP